MPRVAQTWNISPPELATLWARTRAPELYAVQGWGRGRRHFGVGNSVDFRLGVAPDLSTTMMLRAVVDVAHGPGLKGLAI